MARAAVKAKQQAKAKAQPTKAARGRGRHRRHSGGGNPNQELFFVRLRRHQKWVYAVLAVVFGLSFALVGVGSGNGGGLSQLYNGIFAGGGGTSISKAEDEIKTNPKQGYLDLATAYQQKGDNPSAIIALQTYLAKNNRDASTWGELGGLQMSQGSKFGTRLQNAEQTSQLADPSASFLPGGTLGSAIGQNPTYANASQRAAARTSALYKKATDAFAGAVAAYQRVTALKPRSATAWEELATAAQYAGNSQVQLTALKRYLNVYPDAPLRSKIEKQIKALAASTGYHP